MLLPFALLHEVSVHFNQLMFFAFLVLSLYLKLTFPYIFSDFITYNVDTQEISLILDGNNQGTVKFSLTFLELFNAIEWILTIYNVRGNVSYVNCFLHKM